MRRRPGAGTTSIDVTSMLAGAKTINLAVTLVLPTQHRCAIDVGRAR